MYFQIKRISLLVSIIFTTMICAAFISRVLADYQAPVNQNPPAGDLNRIITENPVYISGDYVGIGTASPNRKLHIYKVSGNNAEINIKSISGENNHWAIYHDRIYATDALRFWNNGYNRLTFEDSGEVYIYGKISGLPTPVDNDEIANKAYVTQKANEFRAGCPTCAP